MNPAFGFAASSETPAFLEGADFAFGFNHLDGTTRTAFFQPDETGASIEFANPLPVLTRALPDGSQALIIVSPIGGLPTIATSASALPSFEDVGSFVLEPEQWMGADFADEPPVDDWIGEVNDAVAVLEGLREFPTGDEQIDALIDRPDLLQDDVAGDDADVEDSAGEVGAEAGEGATDDQASVEQDAPEAESSTDVQPEATESADIDEMPDDVEPAEEGDEEGSATPPTDDEQTDDEQTDDEQPGAEQPGAENADPETSNGVSTSSDGVRGWLVALGLLLLGVSVVAIVLYFFVPGLFPGRSKRAGVTSRDSRE